MTVDPEAYFLRYEDPSWQYVPWQIVLTHWDDLVESAEQALEQCCLKFIRDRALVTNDPTVVLTNAEKVYSFLYDPGRLEQHREAYSDFSPHHYAIIREFSILCALNKANQDGRMTNIGAASFFSDVVPVVYDLSEDEVSRLDDLYHGGFYNAWRLRDQVRAQVALGGKLVHGCIRTEERRGGASVVAGYGTNVEGLEADLFVLRRHYIELFEKLRGDL